MLQEHLEGFSGEMTPKLRPASCVALVPMEEDSFGASPRQWRMPELGPAYQLGWGWLRETDLNANLTSVGGPLGSSHGCCDE